MSPSLDERSRRAGGVKVHESFINVESALTWLFSFITTLRRTKWRMGTATRTAAVQEGRPEMNWRTLAEAGKDPRQVEADPPRAKMPNQQTAPLPLLVLGKRKRRKSLSSQFLFPERVQKKNGVWIVTVRFSGSTGTLTSTNMSTGTSTTISMQSGLRRKKVGNPRRKAKAAVRRAGKVAKEKVLKRKEKSAVVTAVSGAAAAVLTQYRELWKFTNTAWVYSDISRLFQILGLECCLGQVDTKDPHRRRRIKRAHCSGEVDPSRHGLRYPAWRNLLSLSQHFWEDFSLIVNPGIVFSCYVVLASVVCVGFLLPRCSQGIHARGLVSYAPFCCPCIYFLPSSQGYLLVQLKLILVFLPTFQKKKKVRVK